MHVERPPAAHGRRAPTPQRWDLCSQEVNYFETNSLPYFRVSARPSQYLLICSGVAGKRG